MARQGQPFAGEFAGEPRGAAQADPAPTAIVASAARRRRVAQNREQRLLPAAPGPEIIRQRRARAPAEGSTRARSNRAARSSVMARSG